MGIPLRIVSVTLLATTIGFAGKLRCEPAELTFGTVIRADGIDRRLDVRLVNDSSRSIEIRQVSIGCGCMSAELTGPGVINPGEHSVVRITLQSHLMRVGAAQYPLSIVGPGGDTLAVATVHYEFRPRLKSIPRDLLLADDDGDGVYEGRALLVLEEALQNAEIRALSENSLVDCELSRSSSNPCEWQLRVLTKRDAPFGHLRDRVYCYLDDGEERELAISVSGDRRPPTVAKPARLVLGELHDLQPIKRRFRLVGADLPDLRVSTSCDWVTVALANDTAAEREYVVSIDPSASPSTVINERVEVSFGGPQPFTVSVSVVGFIKK